MKRLLIGGLGALAIGLTGCSATGGAHTVSAHTVNLPVTTPTVVPVSYTPKTTDFTVGVIITQKHCFGSYGCNYKYDIDPTYVGIQPLPDKKLTVIYTVTGSEEGDRMENFTIDKSGTAHFNKGGMVTAPDGTDLWRR